jgi:selenocysteine lyase/cysteine desulfurase
MNSSNHPYKKDFSDFGKKIWLNAAAEGPLPIVAFEALQQAAQWKAKPYELTLSRFIRVPLDLKETLGNLLGVSRHDVILGNSASYGLHLLANGIPWKKGDEILLMQNDFPTNILPWLGLAKKGVKVHQIKPRNRVISASELAGRVTGRTKLFCISHVHTFSGSALDLKALGAICKKNKILFVVNVSQSAGTMALHVNQWNADAVVCAGYKWLCGPVGTGFCWIRPQLRDQLDLNLANWTAIMSQEELKSEGPIKFKELKSAQKFDIFCTANFFNFMPLKASVDYLLKIGIDQIRQHHDQLIDQFIEELNPQKYFFISPQNGSFRSSLVVFSCQDQSRNLSLFEHLQNQGIFLSFWKGNIRISPHIYNTSAEILRLIEVLNKY